MPTDIPPRAGGKRPSATRSRPAAPRGNQHATPRGKQAAFQARRRRQQLIAVLAIVGVVAVAAVIIGVKVGGSGGPSGVDARRPISSSSLSAVEGLTPAQMKSAAANITLSDYPIPVNGDPLTSAGKPELLYMGAEYCPYCAGERWAMVAALSQFGTFHGLRSIVSSPTDTVASIPTFTFYGSSYTSPYLAFAPVETQTVSGKPLETPTGAELAAEQKYDGPPYVRSGGIPFLDIGGKWVQDGINYDNTAMQHQSFDSVAKQVGTQSSQIGAGIAATAGVLVSDLCQLTGGKSLNGDAACKAFPAPVTKAPAG